MKWAKTTVELDAIDFDPAVKKVCFEEYQEITDDGTIVEDGKTKKKIKGEKKASPADTDEFTEWVTYPAKEKNSAFYPEEFSSELDLTKPLDLDKEGRERYEIFCGGFLFYHDIIIKKYFDKSLWKKYYDIKKQTENNTETFEHKIYFEWFDENGIKLDENSTQKAKKVTIYITPTPDSLNPDPPDPPGGPPPY